MISHDRLRNIVQGVSFGGFRPQISIEVTTKVTSTEERPAILIGIDAVDAMTNDSTSIRLHECFAAPDLDDTQLALWIKERCQDVLLHEMDEFFRFNGTIIAKAVHPVAEGVFDNVRHRTRSLHPMTDIAPKSSKETALYLMKLAMPPFEAFLEHNTALKTEAEKAGDLTPERATLFDQYKDALLKGRGEYEDSIASFIIENFTSKEVDLLIEFYDSPTLAVVQKCLGLGPVVNNLGTAWTTRVLESCPDTWQMLMENVGKWQEKNVPANIGVIIPDGPPGTSGWNRATELDIPSATAAEEAELANMRGDGPTSAA